MWCGRQPWPITAAVVGVPMLTFLAAYLLAHLLIPFLYQWIRPYGYSLGMYGSAAVAAGIVGLLVVRVFVHGALAPTAELVLWGVVPALAILANHLAFVIWGGLRPAHPPVMDDQQPAAVADPAAAGEAEEDDGSPWLTIRVYASSAEQYAYLRDRDRLDEAGIRYRVIPAGAAALQVAPEDAERACAVLGLEPDGDAAAG